MTYAALTWKKPSKRQTIGHRLIVNCKIRYFFRIAKRKWRKNKELTKEYGFNDVSYRVQKNIAGKEKRKVLSYNLYQFDYNKKKWKVKVEVYENSERFYSIVKKKISNDAHLRATVSSHHIRTKSFFALQKYKLFSNHQRKWEKKQRNNKRNQRINKRKQFSRCKLQRNVEWTQSLRTNIHWRQGAWYWWSSIYPEQRQ